MPVGLAERSAKGMLWTISGLAVAEPIRILVTALLARLLSPAEFGLVGMATVVTGLLAVANDFGLQTAIIRRQDVTHKELSSLFWFNLAVGVAMALVCAAVSPAVAQFFGEPEVASILVWLSVGFVLSSLGQIQHALLRKEMDFKSPALAQLTAVVVAGMIAAPLALAGVGIWALVVNALVVMLVSSAYAAIVTRFVPTIYFRWRDVRDFAAFGGIVTAAEFVNYATGNVDNAMVGRVLGASGLGVYGLAYNLVAYPSRRVSSMLAMVTMPAFAQIQGDRNRFARGFERSLEVSMLVVFPVLCSAAVLAPDIILGLYGPKWGDAITPFRLLCIAGMARSVAVLAEVGYKSTGRAARYLAWSSAAAVAVLIGVMAGLPMGVDGVAAGVAAAVVFASTLMIVDCAYAVGARRAWIARAVLRALSLGLAAGLFALGIERLMPESTPRLLAGILGVVLSVGLSYVIFRRAPGYEAMGDLEHLMARVIRR